MATQRKWSARVKTESTYPEEGLFKKSSAEIAKALASKKVSPKGPGSGMRMLTFYINRAGKNLSHQRRAALEKAKEILSGIIDRQKKSEGANSGTAPPSTRKRTVTQKRKHPDRKAA
jgi:tRNA(adenine34) deaminase